MEKDHLISGTRYNAVVIGVSAGGMQALPEVLGPLPSNFAAPVIVVQHVDPAGNHAFFVEYLNARIQLNAAVAFEREVVTPGTVYLAPANYHLMVEADETLSISIDDKVNYSRPSIDVLFESAAAVYGNRLIGILLTGASSDGAKGLKTIKKKGGMTLVQDPATAEADFMPKAAIETCPPDHVLPLSEIPLLLMKQIPFKFNSEGHPVQRTALKKTAMKGDAQ